MNYDTLLKVWNYETGSVGYEYPAWIEKKAVTTSYQLTKFDDGSELKTAGWHGVFDVDKNEFITLDGDDFKVGTRVYKVNENDELEAVTVISIEYVEEEVNYYHVVSSQYYNIIANSIITTDGAVYLSNLYGFDDNIKWPAIREQIMSDPSNLYTYDDFADIGMPRRMFDELRVSEAKYLASKYGITLDVFKWYLISNQLNTDIWLPYCDASPIRTEYCSVQNDENDIETNNDIITSYESDNSSLQSEMQSESESFDSEDSHSDPLGVSTVSGNGETTSSNDSLELLRGLIAISTAVAVSAGSFYALTNRKKRMVKSKVQTS